MAIDERGLQAAKMAFCHERDADVWDAKFRAALEAYEAARKQEPERPMREQIGDQLVRIGGRDATIDSILDVLANPSAAVVEAMHTKLGQHALMFAKEPVVAAWQAAIQRIREGG